MIFMEKALELANQVENDIPVAAIIVKNGEIIATGYNQREKFNDVTLHAEIVALKKASGILKNWRLDECEMFVTLEPCPMCAWAILQSRIKTLYFGAYDTKYGAFGSALDLTKHSDFKTKIYGGIMEEKCESILQKFWSEIRQK